MMKRLMGAMAGAALMIGGAALAQQDTTGSGQAEPQSSSDVFHEDSQSTSGTSTGTEEGLGIGGSGIDEHKLTGTVVDQKSGKKILYVEHMNAVVPIAWDKNTKLEGMTGQKLTDVLKVGDQVEVTFRVKDDRITNLATSISTTAAGGSGFDTSDESRGTGGSGTTLPGEDVGGTSVPDEDPMSQPRDPSLPPRTDDDKPIY